MKNEFDNKLTDKGWRSMRSLLDREMPEQRRRRRFVWWLSALLLLPVGLGGWWIWKDTESAPTPTVPEKAPHVQKPALQAGNQPIRMESTPGETRSQADAIGNTPVSAKGNMAIDEQPHQAPAVTETKSSNTTIASTAVLIPDALPIPTSGGNDPMSVLQPVPALLTYAPDVLPQSTPAIHSDKPIGTNPAPVAAFLPETVKKAIGPKRWTLGAGAGLFSENFTAINGFSAGATLNWQFARKWGLRSGLQFAQYRLAANDRPVVTLDAYEYTKATGNLLDLGTTPISDPVSEVLVPVERLRKLEIPVLAYWQPLRRLRVFSGVTTAYTLSAQASEKNYASNGVYYADDQLAKSNLNSLTSKTLTRWQLGWQLGAGVLIGKHLELSAFYKRGLSYFDAGDQAKFEALDNGSFTGQNSSPLKTGNSSNSCFSINGIWFF